MYQSRKKRSRSINKSISRRKRCSPGKNRSRTTGRCKKYVRVIKRRKSLKECKKRLSNKIIINMEEYKSGRYKSRQQALAVSYSQIKKKYPSCNRYFTKK